MAMTDNAKRSCRNFGCGVRLRSYALLGILTLLSVTALNSPSASASIPPFDGTMSFQAIQGPEGPEEYSWKVTLGDEQELEAIDDQTARVRYSDGHTALVITAEHAHDAVGSTVPTSLAVTGDDVVTLLVHHRAGNPAAAGAPFAYPISAGPGWEGGFSTVIVEGPKDEQELREERERIERERPLKADSSKNCSVPRLKGRSLKASKQRLREAGCRIGAVTKLPGATARSGRVVKQSPRPSQVRAPGSTVRVTLGE